MKTKSLKSAPLLCGALLASICTVTESADAVPVTFAFKTYSSSATGTSQLSLMQGPHNYNSGPQNYTAPFGGGTYFCITNSGPSQRPNFQYEMVIDFTPFGITYAPGTHQTIEMLEIKPPGVPDVVTDFVVKRSDGSLYATQTVPGGLAGGVVNGGTGIRFTLLQADIQAAPGDTVIIQWNQAPAPGALALLGVAGLVGGSRRRRHN
jgi:MYXO-CTERM domain-containing protein